MNNLLNTQANYCFLVVGSCRIFLSDQQKKKEEGEAKGLQPRQCDRSADMVHYSIKSSPKVPRQYKGGQMNRDRRQYSVAVIPACKYKKIKSEDVTIIGEK